MGTSVIATAGGSLVEELEFLADRFELLLSFTSKTTVVIMAATIMANTRQHMTIFLFRCRFGVVVVVG